MITPIIEAKKVIIDVVTLQPIPSESESVNYFRLLRVAKTNKVFTLHVADTRYLIW